MDPEGRVGDWENKSWGKGGRSWGKGILIGKKKKHRERKGGKTYTIAETTMWFSRWCCSLWRPCREAGMNAGEGCQGSAVRCVLVGFCSSLAE